MLCSRFSMLFWAECGQGATTSQGPHPRHAEMRTHMVNHGNIYIYYTVYTHIYKYRCQNPGTLVNTEKAGKWMFLPLNTFNHGIIGVDHSHIPTCFLICTHVHWLLTSSGCFFGRREGFSIIKWHYWHDNHQIAIIPVVLEPAQPRSCFTSRIVAVSVADGAVWMMSLAQSWGNQHRRRVHSGYEITATWQDDCIPMWDV